VAGRFLALVPLIQIYRRHSISEKTATANRSPSKLPPGAIAHPVAIGAPTGRPPLGAGELAAPVGVCTSSRGRGLPPTSHRRPAQTLLGTAGSKYRPGYSKRLEWRTEPQLANSDFLGRFAIVICEARRKTRGIFSLQEISSYSEFRSKKHGAFFSRAPLETHTHYVTIILLLEYSILC